MLVAAWLRLGAFASGLRAVIAGGLFVLCSLGLFLLLRKAGFNFEGENFARLLPSFLVVLGILAGGYLLLLPAPLIPYPRTLRVEASGAHNPLAREAVIEVVSLSPGEPIPQKRVVIRSGWNWREGSLVAEGDQPAVFDYVSRPPEDMRILFRSGPSAGIVQITWNGQVFERDLYAAKKGEVEFSRVEHIPWWALPTRWKLLVAGVFLAEFGALAGLAYAISLLAQWAGIRMPAKGLWALAILLLGVSVCNLSEKIDGSVLPEHRFEYLAAGRASKYTNPELAKKYHAITTLTIDEELAQDASFKMYQRVFGSIPEQMRDYSCHLSAEEAAALLQQPALRYDFLREKFGKEIILIAAGEERSFWGLCTDTQILLVAESLLPERLRPRP